MTSNGQTPCSVKELLQTILKSKVFNSGCCLNAQEVAILMPHTDMTNVDVAIELLYDEAAVNDNLSDCEYSLDIFFTAMKLCPLQY